MEYSRQDLVMTLRALFEELMKGDTRWENHHILQRDPTTWSKDQEELFIDSLYYDFVVNPITVSKRGGRFRILEGGHRVHTIKKWLGNQIKYNGFYFDQLPLEDRYIFDDRVVRYTVYTGLTDLEEEQFILRVNMGLPINSGEFVNMMPSIELCELSRVLGDRYAKSLIEYTDLAGTKNLRGDTSMAMYMVLSNFIKSELIHTERISSVLKLREDAERYRGISLDTGCLTNQVDNFMKIFRCLMPSNKENHIKKPLVKWPRYIVMTIQAIVMKYPNVKPETIHDFIKVVHSQGSRFCPIKNDWKTRIPDANPAKRSACEQRLQVFERWYT